MEVIVKELTGNMEVLNACRMTVWKGNLDKEPSEKFMNDIYMSEHSPIRDKMFSVEIYGIKSWIATHFVRHHIGFTPYVSTQREDRVNLESNKQSRDNAPQGTLVNMRMTLNAQAFINVSRKRLCLQAHPEVTAVWKAVLNELEKIDKPLRNHCVANCIYRNGICPEMNTCGFNFTGKFHKELKQYTERISDKVSIKNEIL